jgi:hypothetical protein
MGINQQSRRTEGCTVRDFLAATGDKLGLLVNFGAYGKLEWQRIANTKQA